MTRFLSFALLALLSFGFVACGSDSEDSEKVLKFTAIPDNDTTLLKQKYEPVAAYLSEKLGIKVEYVPVSDYKASVEQFKNGDIHLAWFGGLTGVQARHAVDGAHAIAQGAEDPNYYSYFIAHADSGLERGDDFPMGLKGKRFTFGSKSSTSGRLMPEHFIRTMGGSAPDEFFTEINFSGSHDKTAELVAAGTFDAGALSYKTYDSMVKDGKIDPAVCKIIWKTPGYPDYNFTAHPSIEDTFGKGTTDKLQKALIEMKDEKLLKAFPRSAIIKAKDSDFDRIKELAEQLDFLN